MGLGFMDLDGDGHSIHSLTNSNEPNLTALGDLAALSAPVGRSHAPRGLPLPSRAGIDAGLCEAWQVLSNNKIDQSTKGFSPPITRPAEGTKKPTGSALAGFSSLSSPSRPGPGVGRDQNWYLKPTRNMRPMAPE